MRIRGTRGRRVFRAIGAGLVAMLAWAGLVAYGTFNGWWHRAIAPAGDDRAFAAAAVRVLGSEPHGDLALVLIRQGEVVAEHYAGREQDVDRDTVFQTASMSKWITALGVMSLVRQGAIDLDAPISRYTKRWSLPASAFDHQGVTIRRLLSHTAGLTDGLGFGDYGLDEPVPAIEETLRHPRASSGRDAIIQVGYAPGSDWRYSGGGYLLLQLAIEEHEGEEFESFMRRTLFLPLGLTRSSFADVQGASNRARPYDADNGSATRFRYAAAAATGFTTSAADMIRLVRAVSGKRPLPPFDAATVKAMRKPHGHQFGADIWGLGTMLYAPTQSGDYVYGHDGQNDPALNAAVRINPDSGDAIIVLTSGGRAPATRIASEWTYWQTGVPDFLAFGGAIQEAMAPLFAGIATLFVLTTLFLWTSLRRRGPTAQAAS